MESYLKNEVELGGDGLKHLAEKESLLIDVLKSVGIIKLKDRVFVMSQIEKLVKGELGQETGKSGDVWA